MLLVFEKKTGADFLIRKKMLWVPVLFLHGVNKMEGWGGDLQGVYHVGVLSEHVRKERRHHTPT